MKTDSPRSPEQAIVRMVCFSLSLINESRNSSAAPVSDRRFVRTRDLCLQTAVFLKKAAISSQYSAAFSLSVPVCQTNRS